MSKDKKQEVHSVTGLKVRRSEPAVAEARPKPRKMNLVKPKRMAAKTVDESNSSMLVFPTDTLGITTEIKAAMIRAGSKVGSDKDTLRLIDEVIRICRGHIQARYEQNVTKPVLKQRVATKVVEDQEESEPASDGSGQDESTISYKDMKAALKEAGVKPESNKKEDVEAAYEAMKAQGDE